MPDTTRDGAKRIEAEHRALAPLLAAIEGHVRSFATDSASQWRAAVQSDIDTLATELEAHFVVEEQAGLFGSFLEEFPRFAPAMHRLLDQHEDLLRQLRDLGARVESGSDAELGRVNDELGRLIQQVRQHEVKESEVLQAAYGVDLGGSG